MSAYREIYEFFKYQKKKSPSHKREQNTKVTSFVTFNSVKIENPFNKKLTPETSCMIDDL